jgi:U3 small nucleolar RNA-associated protein 20
MQGLSECVREEEGLRALLELVLPYTMLWSYLTIFSVITKLIFDLRRTLEPCFEVIFDKLLGLSGASLSASLLTQVLEAISSLLRYISPTSPSLLDSLYSRFLSTFRKCKTEVQRAGGEVWGSVLRRLKGDLRGKSILLILERLEEHDGVLEAWAIISACKV